MKKKITIAMLIALVVLIILSLFFCSKNDNKDSQNPDSSFEENETGSKDDKEETVVEDEVTLDFGHVDESTEVSQETTDLDGANSDMSKNPEEENTDKNVNEKEESQTSNPQTPDSEGTGKGNPYDKDGDGYVDGWY